MRVGLQCSLSDASLDMAQPSNQRQLAISVSAIAEQTGRNAPLNLCLILDHSGSMGGRPLNTVKQAAHSLIDGLMPEDRISIVVFDHQAKVLVANQQVEEPIIIKSKIDRLKASGGTCIDDGLKLGVEEAAVGRQNSVSQVFLLTDGENEHGDNNRCLKLAQLAADYNLTLSTLGFGDHWNQDILEQIADAGNGSLSYIREPEEAMDVFNRLFNRVQSVGLTNAYLKLDLMPQARLAELKPIAQVAPETIELPVPEASTSISLRLGDLMVDVPRVILANLYVSHLPVGRHTIGSVQVQYDNPARGATGLTSERLMVEADVQQTYQPAPNDQVQQHVLALAKYRQTQIAETKLKQGDRQGAATLLQTAAKTALQMGDKNAATVLQENATRLQSGQELSERDRKQTRIASKTTLQ
ncbi:MAG: VWA domain-containing protein [Leptolyngbyaceae cyanobacterium SM1_1_3]|nr:VWA domain-containing protein [Leptolyngbyaceae cyanobacterium SM1_1_3]NJN04342.1 VWA domain-containing protein [Leptolyngbyaceae cyanobacterium RM1_1_2]NJO10551.1 VWA domain-containing protein [Leptolyngbyaceae cyanobacterium SL_1_1]